MSVSGLDINLLGVLVAGVASMLVGFVYYMPNILGDTWMKLAKIDTKRFQKEQPRVMPLVFLGALVTAYIVGYVTSLYHAFYNVPWMTASLMTALIIWVAVSTSIAIHNALDQRSLELTVITIGNRLLTLLAVGLVIGWLHP